jgi:hypothetical protein
LPNGLETVLAIAGVLVGRRAAAALAGARSSGASHPDLDEVTEPLDSEGERRIRTPSTAFTSRSRSW